MRLRLDNKFVRMQMAEWAGGREGKRRQSRKRGKRERERERKKI